MATTKNKPKPKRTQEQETQHEKWVSRLICWGELIRSMDLMKEQLSRAADDGLLTEEAVESAIGFLQDAQNELYTSGIP